MATNQSPTQTPPTDSTNPQASQPEDVSPKPVAPLKVENSNITPSSSKVKKVEPNQATRSKNLVQLSSLILLFIISINGGIIFFANLKSNQLELVRQQITDTRINNLGLEDTLQYLQTGEDQIKLINQALPNSETLVDFINDIENLAKQNSSNPELEFIAIAPSGDTGKRYIPFIITFDTGIQNYYNFLSSTEKLPYLLEVTSIQASKNDSETWRFVTSAKVYVQEPFELSTDK